MTPDELIDQVSRTRCDDPRRLFKIAAEVAGHAATLSFEMLASDRRDGGAIAIIERQVIDLMDIERLRAEDLDYMIRTRLYKLVQHEVDEWLVRDGFHLKDPHPVRL